uniref:Uncharacterized protein n=1 Tax=Anguilla anguilla TaxID=7936 RepID=A0A0E9RHV5_ANGAN
MLQSTVCLIHKTRNLFQSTVYSV